VITTKSLPAGKLGQTYTATLQASGGTPPYTWSASGTLPGGIGFSSAGILSGKPTQKGNFSVTFGVKDSSAGMSDDALNLTVKKRCFLGL
jgi:hypothetical protein